MRGKRHTLETRAKLSVAMTGKKQTLETCAKINNAQTDKKWLCAYLK